MCCVTQGAAMELGHLAHGQAVSPETYAAHARKWYKE